MKILLAYYSFSGKAKALCEELKSENCDLLEISELTKRTKFGAYTKGCFAALKGKASAIGSIDVDMKQYGRIVFACPIWAGHIPPAGIAFLQKAELSGKDVSVIALSQSGGDYAKNVKKAFTHSKSNLAGVRCVRQGQRAEPGWLQ